MMVQESFEILGISSKATLEEVKKAHRSLIKKFHPDLFMHNPAARARAEELSKNINLAVENIKSYLSERKEEVKAEYTVKNTEYYRKPAHQNFYQEYSNEPEAGVMDAIMHRLNKGWNRVVANSYMFASLAGGYVLLKKAQVASAGAVLDLNIFAELLSKLNNF